jgi:hypothetical protein
VSRPGRSSILGRAAGIVVGVCFVVVYALPVHVAPCGTQASHYALVRSLADGTARIDEYEGTTCDKALFRGHYYSVKAPGLAATSLPTYLMLEHAGLVPDDPRWAIWLLSLSTLVPAALLLIYLVWRTAERLVPGWGRLTAIALGIGTIVLPFGSLWFGHVPATMLSFAAFAVVFQRRGDLLSGRRVFAAGLLAGLAVLFEYPSALVAAVVLGYVTACGGLRAPPRFLAGSALPAATLILYNQWAFGSATHFSYRYALPLRTDNAGNVIGENDRGFFGITWPDAHALAQLLFSPRGLLTLSPICVLGAVGIMLCFKRARREAIVLAAITAVYLVYNAGYTLNEAGPFGGDAPGPRFLIAMLPFLLLPLGLAARASPGAAASLLTVSVGAMTLVTATSPMLGGGEEGRWMRELRSGTFVDTALSALGAPHGLAIAPFVVAVAILLVVGLRDLLDAARGRHRETLFAAATALVAWGLVLEASHLLYRDESRGTALVAFTLAAVLAVVSVMAPRLVPTGREPAP